MKTRRTFILGGLALILLAGFALAQQAPSRTSKTNAVPISKAASGTVSTNRETAKAYPVVGYLEKRNQTITIKAGPKGPLYSVQNADGKVILENVTAEQLRAQAPELHEFIKSAVAGNSGKGAVIDASVRPVQTR